MTPDRTQRPTWAEIDLDALAFNYHSIRDFVGRNVEFMAVVKADAYGHGAARCAKRLEHEGADWFAVATIEEGVELRNAGIESPILILGGVWPGQGELFIRHRLTPTLFTVGQLEELERAAGRVAEPIAIHIKIDTGMGRVGFRHDHVAEIVGNLPRFPNLRVEGLMTHFATADDLDSDFTDIQMERFRGAVDLFKRSGIEPKYTDMANSPAAIGVPGSRAGLVRIGGILYGLGDDVLPRNIDKPDLRPVMSLHSRIAQLRAVPAGESIGYDRTYRTERGSRIATIPIGYHDGLRRGLSNRGRVIVNGKPAPIAGRVSMDWTTIDVTDVPEAAEGDHVTIIGRDGAASITAADIAAELSTISYEVTCGIGSRVPRIYTNGDDK